MVLDAGVRMSGAAGNEAAGLRAVGRTLSTVGHFASVGKNMPVECAGVQVRPGDIIVADDDGIVSVPQEKAEAVLKRAQEIDARENKMEPLIRQYRVSVKSGADVQPDISAFAVKSRRDSADLISDAAGQATRAAHAVRGFDLIDVWWMDGSGRQVRPWPTWRISPPSGACLQTDVPVPVETELHICHPQMEFEGRARYCVFRDTGYFSGVQFSNGFEWDARLFQPKHLLDPRELLDLTRSVSLNKRAASAPSRPPSALGRKASSSGGLKGTGVSGAAMRTTGASRNRKRSR